MLSGDIRNFLIARVSERLGTEAVASLEIKGVGGGSINNTYQLKANNRHLFFLKTNKADSYPGLFEKEREGLEFLARQNCIATPAVFFSGQAGKEQLLLLEWVDPGPKTPFFWKKFGEELARLHHCSQDGFGFSSDNYMGALPQNNPWTKNWTDFFITHRLWPQIKLALQNGLLSPDHVESFQQVSKLLPGIFPEEPPSLLHGDLWSGNFICDRQSSPVLIDPAVYYGHRSVDLAMTTLFGGFDPVFYDAYHYHFALPGNYREQWELCNLYPLLIHLNLFGQSYLGQISSTLRSFQ